MQIIKDEIDMWDVFTNFKTANNELCISKIFRYILCIIILISIFIVNIISNTGFGYKIIGIIIFIISLFWEYYILLYHERLCQIPKDLGYNIRFQEIIFLLSLIFMPLIITGIFILFIQIYAHNIGRFFGTSFFNTSTNAVKKSITEPIHNGGKKKKKKNKK